MRVIVTTVTRSPKGNPMRSSREITADQIRIGRGAECELRLADPRVPLHARSIFLGRQGPQLYEAGEQHSDATLAGITGVQRPQALRPGTSLRIGPFQIDVVEPHHGADLALSVELVQPLPGKSEVTADELYAQTSQGPISRRALSWTLFLLVLGFFLALPTLGLFERTAPAPAHHAPLQRLGETAQQSWNPGELAAGHQPFAGNCRACHSDSFTRVQDKDCQACHRNLGDHVAREAKVAGLADVRCASCHRDHQGALALQQQNTHFFMGECSACHRDLKAHLPTTQSGDAADFATLHPQFRATLVTGLDPATGQALQARLRLNGKARLVEQRGLKFSHAVHLDAQGVKGPQGLVKTDCGSCHVPDGSGRGFRPVTMKEHCQSCHELRFELAAPERQLPHGNVDEVMATMRDFYSYLAVNGTVLNQAPMSPPATRGIPGKSAPAPRRLAGRADVDAQVIAAATEIFEKTTCFTCHDITRLTRDDGTPTWKVQPVLPAPDWMPAARFRHDQHDMARCSSCHAAPTSKSAGDVLMPGIETCRGCHAGTHPEKQKVTSNCGLCHGFHQHPAMAVAPPPALPWPSARDAALLQAPTLKPAAAR